MSPLAGTSLQISICPVGAVPGVLISQDWAPASEDVKQSLSVVVPANAGTQYSSAFVVNPEPVRMVSVY